MAKFITNTVLDRQVAEAKGTHIYICNDQPTNFAAVAGFSLGGQAISGSYVDGDGDSSGRKTAIPAQSAVSITSSGTANHIAITNETVSPSELRLVTTCPDTSVTSGGTADIASYDHEVADPT